MTFDGSSLIVSDGSNRLSFWDPESLKESHSIHVTVPPPTTIDGGNTVASRVPVHHLNELEFVNGYIYANVWYQDVVYKISPHTGNVIRAYDLTGLLEKSVLQSKPNSPRPDCLNGIAYRGDTDTFFLTGKLWPVIFEVSLG